MTGCSTPRCLVFSTFLAWSLLLRSEVPDFEGPCLLHLLGLELAVPKSPIVRLHRKDLSDFLSQLLQKISSTSDHRSSQDSTLLSATLSSCEELPGVISGTSSLWTTYLFVSSLSPSNCASVAGTPESSIANALLPTIPLPPAPAVCLSDESVCLRPSQLLWSSISASTSTSHMCCLHKRHLSGKHKLYEPPRVG